MLPPMRERSETGQRAGQGAAAAPADLEAFITRWGASAGAERANYQLFLAELCDVLGVPRPDPSVADEAANRYVFDKAVTFQNPDGKTSTGYIDLYRKGKLPVNKLLSDRITLDQINEGFDRLASGHTVRQLIIF